MSNNDQTVRVDVNERKIGRAAGEAVDDRMKKIERELRETREAVESLETRISQVEQTKARAEREAIESLKDTLQEQVEEKRQEYERRVGDVLEDYRASIKRLKNRFLNSISGQGDHFGSIEDEFAEVQGARGEVVEKTGELGGSQARTYELRTQALQESRNEFFQAIDSFLRDREETASTIESMRTNVFGVSGPTTVMIPFWVYGVEKNGSEEIHVLPVAERAKPDESLTRAQPYADYLRSHPDHGFEDMTNAVHEYVVRDEVRDRLAERDDDAYADPRTLPSDGTRERFINALREFELDRGDSTPRPEKTESVAKVSADD